MSRGKQDAVMVLWDVGLSSLQNQEDGKTFVEYSKSCLKKIIGNKLLVQQKDLLGIVAFGTEETKHPLDEAGFDNIFMHFGLQNAIFDMMEIVDQVQPTNIQGDWMGAMCIALQSLKEREKLAKKSIVIISPLSDTVNRRELKTIIKGTLSVDSTLIFIGKEFDLESSESDTSSETSEKIDDVPIKEAIKRMHDHGVRVVSWSFTQAMVNLTHGYTSKIITPRPWKTQLEIGSVIKIRVCGVNEITAEEKPKFKQLSEKDMDKQVERELSFFEKGNKRKLVDSDEVIQGHKFGTSIVPFSKEDQASLQYQSGPACLKVLGFVDKRRVPPPMYTNTGTHTFYADETDPVAVVSFSTLVKAMHEENKAALVRKVARENGRLIFGALLPQLREEGERLVLVELPFAEDLRHYSFRKFKVETTDEELAAIDELIDNMDLMTAGENGEEAFQSRDTSDPTLVHLNEMLLFRALYPDKELPPPSKHALELLQPPSSIILAAEKMEPILEAAFPNLGKQRKNLPRAGTTAKKPAAERDPDEDAEDLVQTQPLVQPGPSGSVTTDHARVVSVGTVTPAEDFQQLLRQGRDLKEVFKQCEEVVLRLAMHAQTRDEVVKPLSAVRAMRDVCKRQDPDLYNKWLRELYNSLLQRNRPLLWQAIQTEKLGLISQTENPVSNVTEEQANTFLQGEDADASNTMDTDDMFGEVE